MQVLRRFGQSIFAVLALIVLAAVAVALAVWPVPAPVVGVLVLVLEAGMWWEGRTRPGPTLTCLAVAVLLVAVSALAAHDLTTAWLVPAVAIALGAGLLDDPLRQRVVPRVRTVQLPGIRDDLRLREPGPLVPVTQIAGALLGVLLILTTHVPEWLMGCIVLVVVLASAVWCAIRLRSQVEARRRGTVNRQVTQALTEYAPRFYVYFSGPAEGDYQIRMWLPYLERLGVPFAILTRTEELLRRALALTSVPVISSPRMAGLDDCMVPSLRTIFYVNSNAQCADGVRYRDLTHVQLNHGDSDKPSSYHPMYAMFDQNFVAGQAAVDRFARHGVIVPAEKFVLVGRPQVAGILETNTDPLADHRTVLYAPTWRGGVGDMDLSSIGSGETIVRMLLERGVRVVFRPHPLSRRDKGSAATIDRIDDILRQTRTPQLPHLTSAAAMAGSIVDCFNRCDALVTDVSSVASDFLASSKPMAVVDLGALRPRAAADPDQFPVLRATYLLDVGVRSAPALDAMLGPDPLAAVRHELRSYYLGTERDSERTFLDAAARTMRVDPARDG